MTPTHQLEAERREDARPVIIAVRPGLFLGNACAAEDAAALAAHGITQTLNLAVNIDTGALALADGTVVRRAKVGLIDGPGNHPHHVVAAVLAVDGMVVQIVPGKPSYAGHRPGALLVHCRGGRSRSVAVTALWLARHAPEDWPQPADAVAALRGLRGLGPEQPNAAMLAVMLAAWPILERIPTAPL